jgi:hypothetical protein
MATRRRREAAQRAGSNDLPDNVFAFPGRRGESLTDARQVRGAIARFERVEGVGDSERDRAWMRVLEAARLYGIDVRAADWQDLASGGEEE